MSGKQSQIRSGWTQVTLTPVMRMCVMLLAAIAAFSVLYYARSFFLPITLAVIVALTLSPLVHLASRKLHIPTPLSAGFLVVAFGLCVIAGAVTLATPLATVIAEAPRIGPQLQQKLRSLRGPVDSINRAGEEVGKIAENNDGLAVQEVVVKQPGLMSRAAGDMLAISGLAVLTLVLSYFLLVSRDMFFRKVLGILPLLSDKKTALSVAKNIESDVSYYLLTVSIINACLGVALGLAFWLLDMPSPVLWGALAALLNFLPYIGALIGVLASAGVAIVNFETLPPALLPPAAYLLLTALEGQFITPLILGRRFSLNTVVILISIAFWGFMWGPLGVLIAVPLLIILKALCERVNGLSHLGKFLSGEDQPLDAEEDRSVEPRSAETRSG